MTPENEIIAKITQKRKEADEANRSESIDNQQSEKYQGPFDFICYVPNCKFGTNNKRNYERHVVTNHHRTLCYPGKVDLKRLGWSAQSRKWET